MPPTPDPSPSPDSSPEPEPAPATTPPPAPSTSPLKFASALTDHPRAAEAADRLSAELSERLAGPADLVVFFVTPHHAGLIGEIHQRLAEALKSRVVLGLTTQGVIGLRREIESGPAISALAATLPNVGLHAFGAAQPDWPALVDDPAAMATAFLPPRAPNAMNATSQPASEQSSSDIAAPRAMIFLADPFSTPLGTILPALHNALPGLPVIGGLASGGRRAGENRLLLNGDVFDSGALALTFSGPIDVRTTVSQGCRPLGRPLVVTRCQRHIVQQLGGHNALSVLGELVKSLSPEDRELIGNQGLFVGRVVNEYKDRFGRGDFLIRNIVGVDQEQGYFAIGDPFLRVGQTIQFHVRDERTATEDFELLLESQRVEGPAAGALLFTCNGRGSHLFTRPNPDAETIAQSMGDMPLAGFFAAGEIGPIGDQSFVHGHTASLAVFRPRSEGAIGAG
ncbi:MAG: FIST C-terminal domain-containing protein [Planctomycetota bacterium]|nr:FIST C-terminal domain-containing protein [Planctomycetota bacterium]